MADKTPTSPTRLRLFFKSPTNKEKAKDEKNQPETAPGRVKQRPRGSVHFAASPVADTGSGTDSSGAMQQQQQPTPTSPRSPETKVRKESPRNAFMRTFSTTRPKEKVELHDVNQSPVGRSKSTRASSPQKRPKSVELRSAVSPTKDGISAPSPLKFSSPDRMSTTSDTATCTTINTTTITTTAVASTTTNTTTNTTTTAVAYATTTTQTVSFPTATAVSPVPRNRSSSAPPELSPGGKHFALSAKFNREFASPQDGQWQQHDSEADELVSPSYPRSPYSPSAQPGSPYSTPLNSPRDRREKYDRGDDASRGRQAEKDGAENDAGLDSPVSSPRSSPRKGRLQKQRRSISIERDTGIVRQRVQIPFPQAAAAWINSATFNRLDVHAQRAISAMASIQVLFSAGAHKFDDAWAWTAGDSPLRDIGQRGRWRPDNEQDETEFFGGLAAFKGAYKSGDLASYMQAAVQAAGQAAGPNDLCRLRRQAGQALLVACEGMRLSMHKDQIDAAELQTALWAIMALNPSEENMAELRRFVPEPNRRAIEAFVASFLDLITRVENGALEGERQYLAKDNMLKTFYGITAQLLGVDFTKVAEILAVPLSKTFDAVTRILTNKSSSLFNMLCNGDKRFND